MTRTEFDSLETAADSLTGKRKVDEKTFASIAILSERLERLKKLGNQFSNVEFSPYVKEVMAKEKMLAVS